MSDFRPKEMYEPWYMRGAFIWVQLSVWAGCVIFFTMLLGEAGFVLGHIIGLILIYCGVPGRWIWPEAPGERQ